MAEKRRYQRISCAAKCLLYHADSSFSAAITNISISGALIELPGSASGEFLPGDACSFILSNNPTSSLGRYNGRVTRVIPAGVGLEILEHKF